MDKRSKLHILIYIPGLGNSSLGYLFFKWRIRNSNLDVRLVKMNWTDGKNLGQKLEKLLAVIKKYNEEGKKVSLLGISAGGTMAVTAFTELADSINKVITVSSPIVADGKNHPILERSDKGIPIVKAAFIKLQSAISPLTGSQRKQVMTFHPLYDPIVPPACTILEGAINKKTWVIGHFPSITIPQLKYAREIAEFVNRD